MDLKKEWKIFVILGMVFLVFFYLPLGIPRFDNAIFEALYLAKWYAQEHVVFCLLPAFFIAGAISVFLNQQSVMKYLGAKANKVLAYSVASVSGSILAVCSCTVLPLFTGIYRMGAGLGPAVAFLYSGPAINVLAIILTAKVLGVDIGIARAVGAIVFSIVIGLIMHFIYRKEELAKVNTMAELPEPEMKRKLWQNVIYFALMIFILIFANWGHAEPDEVFFYTIWQLKWVLTSISGILFAVVLAFWF
ncbi:MAG: permease, partial [Candidatus Kapaibacterium sp.]